MTVSFAIYTAGAATPLVMAVIATGIAPAVAGLGTTLAAEFTKDPAKKEKLQIAGAALSLSGTVLLTAGIAMGQRNKVAQANKAKQEVGVTNADTGSRRSSTSSVGGRSAVNEPAQQGTQTDIPEVASRNARASSTSISSEPSIDYKH
ncbi:MAG: hypothetical protein ACN6OP_29390 [Pseudomonadales bacterium]